MSSQLNHSFDDAASTGSCASAESRVDFDPDDPEAEYAPLPQDALDIPPDLPECQTFQLDFSVLQRNTARAASAIPSLDQPPTIDNISLSKPLLTSFDFSILDPAYGTPEILQNTPDPEGKEYEREKPVMITYLRLLYPCVRTETGRLDSTGYPSIQSTTTLLQPVGTHNPVTKEDITTYSEQIKTWLNSSLEAAQALKDIHNIHDRSFSTDPIVRMKQAKEYCNDTMSVLDTLSKTLSKAFVDTLKDSNHPHTSAIPKEFHTVYSTYRLIDALKNPERNAEAAEELTLSPLVPKEELSSG